MATDREILHKVTSEAMAGAGAMVSVRFVFGMLMHLEQQYGDNISIVGACDALDKMIRMAELAKAQLLERQSD